jgi:hypothetical protein
MLHDGGRHGHPAPMRATFTVTAEVPSSQPGEHIVKSYSLALFALLFCPATMAQTWLEVGEAGNLPATAQVPDGSGTLAQIDGAINDPSEPNGAGNDRDMYLIQIDDPATFTASTVGGTTLDTQLFLFSANGLGVTFNDDTAMSTQSTITGAFVTAPGVYYLAISRFDRDATGLGQEIWADTPFTAERQPDGAGAANAIDDWNGLVATGITASYSITLTGASFPSSSCADLTITGTGAPGTELIFELTGAEPNALAFLVIGATQGATTVRIGALGALEVGLESRFVMHALGRTNSSGEASLTVRVPPGRPHGLDLFAQGFSARLEVQPPGPPTLSSCTSDVESFHLGS